MGIWTPPLLGAHRNGNFRPPAPAPRPLTGVRSAPFRKSPLMPFLLARVCPRGTGDGTRALGLGLTTHLVPWLVCAPYGRAAAGRAPPGTSWGLCLPALAPLYAPIPPLPLGGPAWESGWGRANTGLPPPLPSDPRGSGEEMRLQSSYQPGRIKMACWVVCLDGPLPPSRM